jgi:hypothetical protein
MSYRRARILLIIAPKFHRRHLPRPFVGDGGPLRIWRRRGLFCLKPKKIKINHSTSGVKQGCRRNVQTDAHVLAGGLETGLASGLGDTCARLVRACSEISCLAFRDSISWCGSEASVADVRTGLTERSDDCPLSLLKTAETLAGSEWDQSKAMEINPYSAHTW